MVSIDVTDVLRLLTATDSLLDRIWDLAFQPTFDPPFDPTSGTLCHWHGPQLIPAINLFQPIYLYSFLFNIFQWWIMVGSSLMDAVWCLPWPLVRVMIQGYSRNVNSFAKDDGRSQQRVCHGSADCRPGGVCTSLAPTDFGSLTLLEYADACT
jgi:hypothetical protein